jgi:TonB family protein
MLVRATRTVGEWAGRAVFYLALFVVVVVLHLALTGALRSSGFESNIALFISGAVVLGLVLSLMSFYGWVHEKRAAWREVRRMKQRLPSGPCCVIWRTAETAPGEEDDSMPWDVIGPLRARYPRLARRLGVEGVAVAAFEVNAEGRAKNIHCVDAWPSDVFYEAAREALSHARFEPKPDVHPRFGASYRMPFVFRIAGAARLKDTGRRARRLRPRLQAAQQAVENLRQTG